MSNTSTVTPYASETSDTGASIAAGAAAESTLAVGAACAIGAVAGAVAVAQWLAEDTPEDRTVLDNAKADRRRERVAQRERVELGRDAASVRPLTSVSLHLRDPETLVRSAEKLGYRLEPLAAPAEALRSQPQILLRSSAGDRLAILRDRAGRVVLQTAGSRERVTTLVRRHTADRVAEHLSARGMDVQTATLPSGEVQILAREQGGRGDGAAVVKTQVLADGNAWVDVDKIRGSRCEQIVQQIAEAVGGEVRSVEKKDAYFQLPGEPAKTNVKV